MYPRSTGFGAQTEMSSEDFSQRPEASSIRNMEPADSFYLPPYQGADHIPPVIPIVEPIRPYYIPVEEFNQAAYNAIPLSPVYPVAATNKFDTSNEDHMSATPPHDFGEQVMNRGYYPAAHEVAICQPLSEIDTRSLTAKQVLFYFGVLTLIQPHLQPTFEYSQDYPGKWTAKLFLYRETLSIPRLRTQMAAKVEICRVALSLLKSRYADWRVPDEPNLALTTPEWLWVEMLEEYARSNKLPAPVFTKYIHKYGYRYETGVGTVACWGVRKFYDTEAQAANAAAHQTLYLLLTEGSSDLFSLSSPSAEGITIKQSSEDATSTEEKDIVRRDNDVCNDVNVDTRQNFPHANQPTSRRSRAESFCLESGGGKRRHDFMSNLVPVSNARISTVSVGKEPEQKSKWGVTVDELLSETRSLNAWSEKVNKICEILHLTPKFTLDSSPIHLPTSCKAVKSYSIWVTFQDDPYLTRAGAIGKVYGFYASEDEAKEACCNRVYNYLLNLVKEDTAFEQEERESYELIKNFGQSKRRKLERMGYAVCR